MITQDHSHHAFLVWGDAVCMLQNGYNENMETFD